MTNNIGIRWIRIAAVYIVLGISLGIYMGVKEDFTLHAVHAHMNLLGWVSMALIGLIYQQFPQISSNGLAKAQFWMHNVGLPVQMSALTLYILGNQAVAPVLGIADIVVGLAFVLFLINLLRNLKA